MSLLIELNRDEIAARAADAVALVPIGATEQHGPHLPVGTDLIIAEHLAGAAATVCAANGLDVIVAPSVPIGFSPYHQPLGATLTTTMAGLLGRLEELGTGLAGCGFRSLFLLNGHGGNGELIAAAARSIGQRERIRVAAASYWLLAWVELDTAGVQDHGRLPGHAGMFETALISAIRPDLVRDPPDRPAAFRPNPPGYFAPYHLEDPATWEVGDGFSDNPARANAMLGRTYLDLIVSAVASGLAEFAGR